MRGARQNPDDLLVPAEGAGPRYNESMRLPVWAVLAASAAGCSVIIPLDYTGGQGAASGTGAAGTGQGGSNGGSPPRGGTSNGAEPGAGEGGNGDAGSVSVGGSSGSSGRGGSDRGGQGGTAMGGSSMGGVGGSSMGGEDNGGVPPEGGAGSGTAGGGMGGAAGGGMGGTAGGGKGGTAGGGKGGTAGGGKGGTAGGGKGGTAGGGKGGTAGGGMGGSAGCSFDLTSNPEHCGSCTNACPPNDDCIDSKCVSSPCDELGCGSIQMATNNGDGPRKDSVGTTNDVCVEVLNYTPDPGYQPAINCWNVTTRTIEVNEVAITCGGDKPLTMPKRKDGYCFHAFPGDTNNAGFLMPRAPSGCCGP